MAERRAQSAESGAGVVIKLGGSLLGTASLDAIAARWKAGEQIVLVHGGGKHIDAALASAGIAKRTHAGLRITDDATLSIVVSVLTGQVNKMLVSALAQLGVTAAGIAGCDGSTLLAERHPPVDGVDLGHVGHVIGANPALIQRLLDGRLLPVVAPIAIGADGALFNVNADTAAAAIAASVNAHELVFLTDVAGLLDENGEVVATADERRIRRMIARGVVRGGMRPKLEASLTALRSGVARVSIGSPSGEGGTALVAA